MLDTGINWDNAGLRDQVALNGPSCPPPRPTARAGATTCNGNGVLDVDDYKDDPRVGKRRARPART